jgi:hypothetical protein
MDGTLFDRITKTLVDRAPRREAVKAFAGGGFAALAARIGLDEADSRKRRRKKRKNKKKREEEVPCVGRGATCGGQVRCCEEEALVACQEFPWSRCTDLSGFRCCGLEGAPCVRGNGDDNWHCGCCPDFYCNISTNRCQGTPT